MKPLLWEELSCYSYVSSDLVHDSPKGIVICCHGFSDNSFYQTPPKWAESLAKENILFLFPYYNDSGWANDATISYIDMVLDCVYNHYGITDGDIPLVVTGGSMGGLTSLIYTVKGRYHPVAVGADCPASDLREFFKCSGSWRFMLGAYADSDYSMEELLADRNPIERVKDMPKIPYMLIAGEKDELFSVSYQKHFVDIMREAGHDIDFIVVENMGHCGTLDFDDAYEKTIRFYVDNIEKAIANKTELKQ